MDTFSCFAEKVYPCEVNMTGCRCVLLPAASSPLSVLKRAHPVRAPPIPFKCTWHPTECTVHESDLLHRRHRPGHHLGDPSVELDMSTQSKLLGSTHCLRVIPDAAPHVKIATSRADERVEEGRLATDPDVDLHIVRKVGCVLHCSPRICWRTLQPRKRRRQ